MCCIKSTEIWQKINAITFQLVLRDQRGWVQLGLISDYNQFSAVSLIAFNEISDAPVLWVSFSIADSQIVWFTSSTLQIWSRSIRTFMSRFTSNVVCCSNTVSLIEFNRNFHEHRFTNSMVCQFDTISLVEFNKNFASHSF